MGLQSTLTITGRRLLVYVARSLAHNIPTLFLLLAAVFRQVPTMPNYTPADRPYDTPIRTIVIHCTEQDYTRSVELLTHRTDASAHYLIRASDGYVLPLVPEQHIAWHCGNKEINAESIGIEVEGYVSQHDRSGAPHPFTDAEMESAARLVREICRRYGITPEHIETRMPNGRILPDNPGSIFGHDQVPDPTNPALAGGRSHHLDPGHAWDWDKFMRLVRE